MKKPTPSTSNADKPKKINQHKHNKSIKEERRIERVQQEVKLRKLGFTYREIGEQLGIDHTVVFDDVKRELDKSLKETAEDINSIRQMELDRIDSVLPKIMMSARSGDLKAIDTMLKLMDRRSKYLGLDAAQKQEQAGVITVYLDERQKREL